MPKSKIRIAQRQAHALLNELWSEAEARGGDYQRQTALVLEAIEEVFSNPNLNQRRKDTLEELSVRYPEYEQVISAYLQLIEIKLVEEVEVAQAMVEPDSYYDRHIQDNPHLRGSADEVARKIVAVFSCGAELSFMLAEMGLLKTQHPEFSEILDEMAEGLHS